MKTRAEALAALRLEISRAAEILLYLHPNSTPQMISEETGRAFNTLTAAMNSWRLYMWETRVGQ